MDLSCVNGLYRYDAVIDGARASFKSGKPEILLLNDFLAKDVYEKLRKDFSVAAGKEIYVPHECGFDELKLNKEVEEFFSSLHFRQFLTHLTGIKIKQVNLEARRFKHQSFTLMHDDANSKERFVFFYVLTSKDWKSEWGGSTIFRFGDARLPAVFEPKGNSLAIMRVPKGMQDFVKYVNHFSGKNMFVKVSGTAL